MSQISRKLLKIQPFLISKICLIIVILMFVVTIVLLFLSLSNASEFDYFKNWLSDLGSTSLDAANLFVSNSLTELYFNTWLEVLSVLLFLFGASLEIYVLSKQKDKRLIYLNIAGLFYILGAVFLSFVALLPQSYPLAHKTTSFLAVISIIVGVLIITFFIPKDKKIKNIIYFLNALAIFAILFIPGAVGELILIFSLLLLTLIFGIILVNSEKSKILN